MNIIILEAFGWEKGWQILTAIAANADKFTHSSSDPIKAVVSGQVAAATAVCFYAQAKIAHLGEKAVGFSYVPGKTIFNSDPVGILKGAKNLLPAQRFVDFLLSPRAQNLFILPKGVKGGPKFANLSRIAVIPEVYNNPLVYKGAINPFTLKNSGMNLDLKKLLPIKIVVSDLVGTYHIAFHRELKKLWDKSKGTSKFKLPVTRKEILNLSKRWHEPNFRQKTLKSWREDAQKIYYIKKGGA
jgi:hypothetical protein